MDTHQKKIRGIGLGTVILLCGCNSIHVVNQDGQKKTTTSIYVPAWPWQDSAAIVSRFNLSARTNAYTLSLKSEQTEVTSTNVVSLIESVVGAAVRAAIKP